MRHPDDQREEGSSDVLNCDKKNDWILRVAQNDD